MNETSANKPGHRIEWLVWSALLLTVASIAVAFIRARMQGNQLHRSLDMVAPVPNFTLTNQFGQAVSLSNLLGQVWVADVIFTRCPMSCERMTQRMRALQKEVSPRWPVRFVSLTADPTFDSPSTLKAYAVRHGVDQDRWHFLTGIKRDVYALSVGGLKFTVLDNDDRSNPDNLFVHSTKFVLVDKSGNIRGYFEGTEEEERRQLFLAIEKLRHEK